MALVCSLGVAELEERGRDRVVHDLDHASANQLLVLDEREVRLDAGGVAVHHEADGASGREHSDLSVAVSELLAVSEGFVPSGLGAFKHCGGNVLRVDVVHRGAVHADDVEERLAVVVVAGASASGDGDGHHEFAGGRKRRTLLGDDARLPVGFAAHDGGDAGGVVTAGVGVVGQA